MNAIDRRRGGSIALLALLAACSGKPDVRPAAAPPPAVSLASEIGEVEDLLNEGDAKEARKRLRVILKRAPMDASAQLLLDSIDRDPKELLGPTSYPRVVKPGETMRGLAEELLGNRLKAYQLSRYNGIEKPSSLSAGQTLRIPGTPPRPPAPPRDEPPPHSAAPATKPRPAPAPARPKPAAPAANPAAAAQARAAGLAALNGGNVGRAVLLLRRAAALDPANPVIARDLQRAQRIAATVRARK